MEHKNIIIYNENKAILKLQKKLYLQMEKMYASLNHWHQNIDNIEFQD